MRKIAKLTALFLVLSELLAAPILASAQADFNPQLIISDPELQDYQSWTRGDIQRFLDGKGSYLKSFFGEDASGTLKSAADIIYETAQRYQISPKYLLVTLQKEQSLITDDSPTPKQLDWAAGFGVCDNCSMDDLKIQKYRGFGRQVDNAGGIMRWYYENRDKSFIKKKDLPVSIDDQNIIPQSWATAFLYTYTPHLHGNRNFWRIWKTWFEQLYPNGTLLESSSADVFYLVQNGAKRKFKNKSALVSRVDPHTAIIASDADLSNYQDGPEIIFSNYSLLRTSSATYLIDYDDARPFASEEVVRQLGYNPDEVIEVSDSDLVGFSPGSVITASTTAPQGVIYKISDLNNTFYLFKDNLLYPIIDKNVIETNFRQLRVENHRLKDLARYETSVQPIIFSNGTLVRIKGSDAVYVIDRAQRRRIADEDTFISLGYKKSNIVQIDLVTALSIPEGEPLFVNVSLTSARHKFLGDSAAPISDLYSTELPSYLVAEFPSGRIISGKNVGARLSIASLTKLFTAYEALRQDFDLTKNTSYSARRFAIEKNTLQLVDGEKLRNRDIFNAMLVSSVNTAARMVAQGTGLEEENFVRKVNQRLEEWGADSTTIADVTGLEPGNKSTARDLLKVFVKILGDKTIRDSLGRRSYAFREVVNKNKIAEHTLHNSNKLMSRAGRNYQIIASKTGYTDEAGAVLIMLVKSARTKKQYVIITLGNTNYAKRFDEPNNIAAWISSGRVKISKQ